MATIYLAGPIEQVTLDSASNWRAEAARILADEMGHVVCDPNATWITSKESRIVVSPRECGAIVYGDLQMVSAVDALVAWVDKDTKMCGTYIEVGWALAHNKPIVFYTPTGNVSGFVSGLRYSASKLSDSKVEIFTDIGRACGWLDHMLKEA